MRNGSPNTKVRRGILAGLLTFFAGPPLGGAVFAILILALGVIESVTGKPGGASPGLLDLLLTAPLFLGYLSVLAYFAAWAPAAVSALYVAFRVGFTGWMTWAETVLLAVLSLAAAPIVQDFISRGRWGDITPFLIGSLPSALALRYIAGRKGLVRKAAG